MANSATVQTLEVGSAQAPAWHASLRLVFGMRARRCRLVDNRHHGPLRLQRLLHPQGAASAEALLLHPPGGIAGGDQLAIEIGVNEGASVLATTPGAAKWYRSHGSVAGQSVVLNVAAGSALEWLPQESILFDGSDVRQTIDIALADDARMIGWDIVQLGRIAAAEQWRSGRWQQHLHLRRDGRLIWCEQADLVAASPLRTAAQGLAGFPVFGTLWACAPGLDGGALLEAVRATLDAGLARHRHSARTQAAATWLAAPRGVLLVRALSDDAESLRAILESVWSCLRRTVIGLDVQRPRIWST